MPYIQKDQLNPDEFYGDKNITFNNRPQSHSAAMLVDYNNSRANKNVTIPAKRYEERPSVCIQPACIQLTVDCHSELPPQPRIALQGVGDNRQVIELLQL